MLGGVQFLASLRPNICICERVLAPIAELYNLKQHLTMADEQQFCLRWNDFQTNMVASFKHLRDEKSFCDVTIATEVFSI